jgi:hypothetical protein
MTAFDFSFPAEFDSETRPTPPTSAYYDRFHFLVEDIHGEILARDLIVQEANITRMLAGPCQIEFKIHPKEPSVQMPDGSGPIQFKPWGHWIHAVKMGLDGEQKIWASGIFQPSEIDPESGIMTVRAQGFADYPKGIPWLQNWNPIAVDPFEIVDRIWDHIQHGSASGSIPFVNGDLGVTVYPTDSGTQMLPGFSFNNEEFVQDFFAIFIRAVDRNDCGDYINRLARDIPFDYWEESTFNEAKTAIAKKIRLAYPQGGVDQTDLVFRMGENVIAATHKQESEVEWISDITINGYFPGKVYSHTLENADPDRYRRVLDEVDLHVDSNERAAAWARRKLSRRQFPRQFESIVIEPYHFNAPFGSFDVGDLVRVQGPTAWGPDINQKHKIMAMVWDEKTNKVQLNLMAEGAFNYDPIEYVPS